MATTFHAFDEHNEFHFWQCALSAVTIPQPHSLFSAEPHELSLRMTVQICYRREWKKEKTFEKKKLIAIFR